MQYHPDVIQQKISNHPSSIHNSLSSSSTASGTAASLNSLIDWRALHSKFVAVNDAYQVLSRPDSRAQYDRTLPPTLRAPRAPRASSSSPQSSGMFTLLIYIFIPLRLPILIGYNRNFKEDWSDRVLERTRRSGSAAAAASYRQAFYRPGSSIEDDETPSEYSHDR